jgi:hypothetical protein
MCQVSPSSKKNRARAYVVPCWNQNNTTPPRLGGNPGLLRVYKHLLARSDCLVHHFALLCFPEKKTLRCDVLKHFASSQKQYLSDDMCLSGTKTLIWPLYGTEMLVFLFEVGAISASTLGLAPFCSLISVRLYDELVVM